MRKKIPIQKHHLAPSVDYVVCFKGGLLGDGYKYRQFTSRTQAELFANHLLVFRRKRFVTIQKVTAETPVLVY